MTQVTILDEELPNFLRLLHLGAAQPKHICDPVLAHLCYRLGQRVEARLYEITSPTTEP